MHYPGSPRIANHTRPRVVLAKCYQVYVWIEALAALEFWIVRAHYQE
jgi:hypothetical protein